MSKDKEKTSSGTHGNFKSTPQENGAHVDKSYGKGMGQPMQKIIGTESVSDPIGKGKK